MIKFSNPVPGSRVQESQFSKTVELFSFPNDSVVSPYAGIVVSYDPNNCGGKMKIKHVVGNDTYFSEFCNLVSSSSFFSGVQVREGQAIGQLGSNNLEYTIKNSNGDKQNVKNFLSGINSDKKNEKKPEVKPDIKPDIKPSDAKGYGKLGNALFKAMLFPFGMVSDTMEINAKKDEMGRKKKEEDRKKKEEEELKSRMSEEIIRIKQLLK